MTKDILIEEISSLRDKIISLKSEIPFTLNSDEARHMMYTLEETEECLKEKMTLFNLNFNTN